MEAIRTIWESSVLGRFCLMVFAWFSRQWQNSRVVHWFLHPRGWGEGATQNSVFYRLTAPLHRLLCRLYRLLRLDRLLGSSVLQKSFFWCALPVALSPLLPTMAVLGLALLGALSVLIHRCQNVQRLDWAPENRYLILYAAVFFAAIFLSVDVKSSLLPGLLTVCFTLFALAVYAGVETRRQLYYLVDFVLFAGALVACYGILQYLLGWGYQSSAWVDQDMFSSIRFRVASTLDNPNMLGEYLILCIPLGGARLLAAKSWGPRLYALLCCAPMCLCLILTFSRGAWLGLIFAALVFVVLKNPRWLILSPLALLLLLVLLPDSVVSRFTSIGNLTDQSTSYRVYIWMGTLDMLREYWMCGVGPGNEAFNLIYPAFSYSGIKAPHAHNLFLQLVCDGGVVLLLVFLLLLFVFYRHLCVSLRGRKKQGDAWLVIGVLAGMSGFLVQAMTDYSFYNYRVMFFFWGFFALGMLAARGLDAAEPEEGTA